VLEPETDLVLQAHMQRTGKTECLQPEIGLYFTNKPPIRPALVLGLVAKLIDIPAGESSHVLERSFTLPVDVQVLSVLPHLHYLGKEVQAFATLPDGSKTWLLLIKRWDFNWQGEYRFKKPVFLPRGTTLTMHYTYDNSDQNVRNPHHPPQRVTFGPQSTDEMGELWLQLLPNSPRDLAILQQAKSLMDLREARAFHENCLRAHPDDALAHVELGKLLGPLGEKALAVRHFLTALQLDPNLAEANYYAGLILSGQRRYAEAREKFDRALRANPDFYKAHLGMVNLCIEEGNLADAERHAQAASRINPKDAAGAGDVRAARKSKIGSQALIPETPRYSIISPGATSILSASALGMV
jgi:tetratricopeptide (TPR) repeat protein